MDDKAVRSTNIMGADDGDKQGGSGEDEKNTEDTKKSNISDGDVVSTSIQPDNDEIDDNDDNDEERRQGEGVADDDDYDLTTTISSTPIDAPPPSSSSRRLSFDVDERLKRKPTTANSSILTKYPQQQQQTQETKDDITSTNDRNTDDGATTSIADATPTHNSTQQDDRLKQNSQKDATERSAGVARMDGLQEEDDQPDVDTSPDEVSSDSTPFNPLFTTQDIDDKRLLYNRFNNHNDTTGCDQSLDATVGDRQEQGTHTGDDNNTEYDDDEDSVATRPPSHPDSKYVMDMNYAEHDSLRSTVGAFAVGGRSRPGIYAVCTGGVTNDTPYLSPTAAVSSQPNGHSSLQHQNIEDRSRASVEQSFASQSEEGVILSSQEEPQSASNQAAIDGVVISIATLVGENEGEVVEATPVSFMEWKRTRIAFVTIIFVLLGIVVVIPVLFTQNKKNSGVGEGKNDPIVGTSDFMPASSIDGDDVFRLCMGGECPIGNLFNDALRWASGADFAVMNSGGLRGPGWPAGGVRMSDIWAAYPSENFLCTGVMSGVSVLRLLDYSTASATFESRLTETGDRLLQMSGMQISYNTLLQGSSLGRLISVKILDADSQEYLPLDHAKMYKFATDGSMCGHMDPFSSLFQTMGMKGEVPGFVDDQVINVQGIVGEYLTSLRGPYSTTLRGSHVNDTEAFEPFSFPTLDIVQDRGHIRCGFRAGTIKSGGFYIDLCRAVAAVLFGDPDKYVGVPLTGANRFQQLHERFVDILLLGDTHTVEREVSERATNVGFAFSAPYYYDGMAYLGNVTFVKCAEDEKRHGECQDLKICVTEGSTGKAYVEIAFPISYIFVTSVPDEDLEMLLEGKCNVIASDRSVLVDFLSRMGHNSNKFVLGDKLMTKEPLAAVSRSSDQIFSDVINWVIQALFYGEEKGLTRDPEKCQKQMDYITHPSSLNFLNAVYCVGNYSQIVFNGTDTSKGMNSINGGDSGMLYAIPFGSLDGTDGSISITKDTLLATTKQAGSLGNITQSGSLDCGVVILDVRRPEVNITNTDNVPGMSIDYCHALAAGLFNGDYEAVNILQFSSSDASFNALSNGTIDVLAGARVEFNSDIGRNAKHKGFHFSSAYYFGNESASDDLSVYSMATREGNDLFSSFVNCVVLATMYAEEEDIGKENYKGIPQISLFGPQFALSLRDAISYSGSYNELYAKHFGEYDDKDRGRNILNNRGGPKIHSLPGLAAQSHSINT